MSQRKREKVFSFCPSQYEVILLKVHIKKKEKQKFEHMNYASFKERREHRQCTVRWLSESLREEEVVNWKQTKQSSPQPGDT